jgi:hypothetical protein
MNRIACCVAAIACVSLQAAWAQSRATVEQKEALVRRLLGDSPAAQRIEASGNEQAREFFRQARERHEGAVKLMQSADLARAEAELNQAMWMAGKARQLVPDPMRRQIELRVQNRSMTLAIQSLRDSYERHLRLVRGLPAATGVSDETLAAIDARLEEALSFSGSEQVQEANEVLRSVERHLISALGRILGSDTLDYAQRFETQAEEFAFELARNRSYEELLPLARAELRPGREAVALMERYSASNASLVERARKSASRREYAAALDAVRQATSYLQSALLASGLAVPANAAAQGAGR